jgi:hypothetical protein
VRLLSSLGLFYRFHKHLKLNITKKRSNPPNTQLKSNFYS